MDDQDFEVQISNLDELETEAAHKAISTIEFHSPGFLPRQRKQQLAVTIGIVLLSILLLLGNYEPTRTSALKWLMSPTPTSIHALVPELDRFYFVTNPSWGHLSIDGKPVPHLPSLGEAPFKLAYGHHMLRWLAEPFQPQHCILSVPIQVNSDTCQIGTAIHTVSGLDASLIVFSDSLAMLSHEQRDALTQAVQSTLDAQKSTDIVLPGEAYAVSTNKQHFALAAQPLRATLHFQLDTDPTSLAFCVNNLERSISMKHPCSVDEQDCRLFCSANGVFQTARAEWNVFGVIRFIWDYATLDGRAVMSNQPDTTDSLVGDAQLVPMHITWDGTVWHVTTSFTNVSIAESVPSDPICFPAEDELNFYGTFLSDLPLSLNTPIQYFGGSIHAAGCLVVVTLQPGASNQASSSQQPVAYCLHRFGVFVAANSVAYQFWPHIPLADAHEQELAHQLLLAEA
jgi:hypothetical protein